MRRELCKMREGYFLKPNHTKLRNVLTTPKAFGVLPYSCKGFNADSRDRLLFVIMKEVLQRCQWLKQSESDHNCLKIPVIKLRTRQTNCDHHLIWSCSVTGLRVEVSTVSRDTSVSKLFTVALPRQSMQGTGFDVRSINSRHEQCFTSRDQPDSS